MASVFHVIYDIYKYIYPEHGPERGLFPEKNHRISNLTVNSRGQLIGPALFGPEGLPISF